MITKERLEELIKNKGMVWVYSTYSKPYRILPITFDGKREINSHTFCLNWNVKNIFETKEDAEFYAEFSCIERIERLELPTWEEFDEQKFIWFVDKSQNQCCLYYLNVVNKIFINVSGEVIEIGDLTKENYTLACRKAKGLFLGAKK